MARFAPGSQSRELMQQKRQVARTLLQRGLSIQQVTRQLRCSPYLVREVKCEMQAKGVEA